MERSFKRVFFRFIYLFYVCIYVLSPCMYVHHLHAWCSCAHGGQKRVLGALELEFGGCAPPKGCLEQNQGPLREQLVLRHLSSPKCVCSLDSFLFYKQDANRELSQCLRLSIDYRALGLYFALIGDFKMPLH